MPKAHHGRGVHVRFELASIVRRLNLSWILSASPISKPALNLTTGATASDMGGIVRASLPVFPLTRGLFTVRLGVMPYGLRGQPHGGLAVFWTSRQRATVRAGPDSHCNLSQWHSSIADR